MELKDTVEMMLSDDWKERFKAEVHQLEIRRDKLEWVIDNWDNLDFEPSSSKQVYQKQLGIMNQYLDALYWRAEGEGIEL